MVWSMLCQIMKTKPTQVTLSQILLTVSKKLLCIYFRQFLYIIGRKIHKCCAINFFFWFKFEPIFFPNIANLSSLETCRTVILKTSSFFAVRNVAVISTHTCLLEDLFWFILFVFSLFLRLLPIVFHSGVHHFPYQS